MKTFASFFTTSKQPTGTPLGIDNPNLRVPFAVVNKNLVPVIGTTFDTFLDKSTNDAHMCQYLENIFHPLGSQSSIPEEHIRKIFDLMWPHDMEDRSSPINDLNMAPSVRNTIRYPTTDSKTTTTMSSLYKTLSKTVFEHEILQPATQSRLRLYDPDVYTGMPGKKVTPLTSKEKELLQIMAIAAIAPDIAIVTWIENVKKVFLDGKSRNGFEQARTNYVDSILKRVIPDKKRGKDEEASEDMDEIYRHLQKLDVAVHYINQYSLNRLSKDILFGLVHVVKSEKLQQQQQFVNAKTFSDKCMNVLFDDKNLLQKDKISVLTPLWIKDKILYTQSLDLLSHFVSNGFQLVNVSGELPRLFGYPTDTSVKFDGSLTVFVGTGKDSIRYTGFAEYAYTVLFPNIIALHFQQQKQKNDTLEIFKKILSKMYNFVIYRYAISVLSVSLGQAFALFMKSFEKDFGKEYGITKESNSTLLEKINGQNKGEHEAKLSITQTILDSMNQTINNLEEILGLSEKDKDIVSGHHLCVNSEDAIKAMVKECVNMVSSNNGPTGDKPMNELLKDIDKQVISSHYINTNDILTGLSTHIISRKAPNFQQQSINASDIIDMSINAKGLHANLEEYKPHIISLITGEDTPSFEIDEGSSLEIEVPKKRDHSYDNVSIDISLINTDQFLESTQERHLENGDDWKESPQSYNAIVFARFLFNNPVSHIIFLDENKVFNSEVNRLNFKGNLELGNEETWRFREIKMNPFTSLELFGYYNLIKTELKTNETHSQIIPKNYSPFARFMGLLLNMPTFVTLIHGVLETDLTKKGFTPTRKNPMPPGNKGYWAFTFLPRDMLLDLISVEQSQSLKKYLDGPTISSKISNTTAISSILNFSKDVHVNQQWLLTVSNKIVEMEKTFKEDSYGTYELLRERLARKLSIPEDSKNIKGYITSLSLLLTSYMNEIVLKSRHFLRISSPEERKNIKLVSERKSLSSTIPVTVLQDPVEKIFSYSFSFDDEEDKKDVGSDKIEYNIHMCAVPLSTIYPHMSKPVHFNRLNGEVDYYWIGKDGHVRRDVLLKKQFMKQVYRDEKKHAESLENIDDDNNRENLDFQNFYSTFSPTRLLYRYQLKEEGEDLLNPHTFQFHLNSRYMAKLKCYVDDFLYKRGKKTGNVPKLGVQNDAENDKDENPQDFISIPSSVQFGFNIKKATEAPNDPYLEMLSQDLLKKIKGEFPAYVFSQDDTTNEEDSKIYQIESRLKILENSYVIFYDIQLSLPQILDVYTTDTDIEYHGELDQRVIKNMGDDHGKKYKDAIFSVLRHPKFRNSLEYSRATFTETLIHHMENIKPKAIKKSDMAQPSESFILDTLQEWNTGYEQNGEPKVHTLEDTSYEKILLDHVTVTRELNEIFEGDDISDWINLELVQMDRYLFTSIKNTNQYGFTYNSGGIQTPVYNLQEAIRVIGNTEFDDPLFRMGDFSKAIYFPSIKQVNKDGYKIDDMVFEQAGLLFRIIDQTEIKKESPKTEQHTTIPAGFKPITIDMKLVKDARTDKEFVKKIQAYIAKENISNPTHITIGVIKSDIDETQSKKIIIPTISYNLDRSDDAVNKINNFGKNLMKVIKMTTKTENVPFMYWYSLAITEIEKQEPDPEDPLFDPHMEETFVNPLLFGAFLLQKKKEGPITTEKYIFTEFIDSVLKQQ